MAKSKQDLEVDVSAQYKNMVSVNKITDNY